MSATEELVEATAPGPDDGGVVTTALPRLTPMTERGVRIAAGVMLAVAFAVRTWTIGAGFFYVDDYVVEGRGGMFGLFSQDLLLYFHNVHLMPGAFFLGGVAARVAPMQYWFPLLTLVLMQGLYYLLSWKLVGRLFGWRPLALVPLGVLVLAPVTLLPLTWWSAALNTMPLLIAALGASLCAVRLHDTGRGAWAVGGIAWLLFGLLFFEKSVLVLPIALAVVWIAGTGPDPVWARLWHVLRRGVLLWGGMLVVVLMYGLYYVSRVTHDSTLQLGDTPRWFELAGRSIMLAFLPASVGGPLSWADIGQGSAAADPPLWVVVGAAQVLAILVVGGCLMLRRARLAWSLVALLLVADAVALSYARALASGLAAQTLRYNADALVLMAVAVGASLMPMRGTAAGPTYLRVRAFLGRRPRWVLPVGGLVAYLVVVLALISTITLAAPVNANTSRAWTMGVQRQLALHGPATFIDQTVPVFVADPLGYPTNLYSSVLSPLRPTLSIVPQTDTLRTIDDSGTFIPATVQGPSAKKGPAGPCNYAVRDGITPVDLTGPVFTWGWVMKIDYAASEDTVANVRLGAGTPMPIAFSKGLHTTYFNVEGGGDSLTIGPTTNGVGMCVGGVTVGKLTPAPPTP